MGKTSTPTLKSGLVLPYNSSKKEENMAVAPNIYIPDISGALGRRVAPKLNYNQMDSCSSLECFPCISPAHIQVATNAYHLNYCPTPS